MMQQYGRQGTPSRHAPALPHGDFYELFDADAEVASRVLGLTLTSRDKTIPSGFSAHALEPYLRSSSMRGHRVAICDQVEIRRWQGAGSPRSNTGGHARHAHGRRPSRPAPFESPGGRCRQRRPPGWPGLGRGYPRAVQAADVPWQRLGRAEAGCTVRHACARKATRAASERLRRLAPG